MAFSDADLQKIADEYKVPTENNKPRYPNPDAMAFVLLSTAIRDRRENGINEPGESIDLYKELSQKLSLKFKNMKESWEKSHLVVKFTPKKELTDVKRPRPRADIEGPF